MRAGAGTPAPQADATAGFTVLPWDSDRFGFPVARLHPSLAAADVDALLPALRQAGVRLAYWSVPEEVRWPAGGFTGADARLVDRRVTFAADPAAVPVAPPDQTIESYAADLPEPDVRDIGLASGEHSRFRTDPRIDPAVFEAIYDAWITRSVRREIAAEVLVARRDGRVAGLVTLAERDGEGTIGLIAVDARARGRGIGRKLVEAALAWSRGRGHDVARVVTQLDNRPACALYEACGYHVERVEHVYHLWLDPA